MENKTAMKDMLDSLLVLIRTKSECKVTKPECTDCIMYCQEGRISLPCGGNEAACPEE